MRLKFLAAIFAALLFGSAAHADTITTYTVNGTGAGGFTLSGTMTIDTTAHLIESVDLDAGGVFLTAIQSQDYNGGDYEGIFGPSSATFNLTPSVFFLSGPNSSYSATFTTETAIASEPATLVLLGIGLVAVFLARHRLV